jgi:probable rRNA maturation factor
MKVRPFKRLSVEALKRENTKARGRKSASTLQHFNASTIAIANRQRTKKINTRLLKEVVSALLAELEISEAELGINLVGAKEMARVNWQYLQHEGSTDVITFDHSNAECGVRSAEYKFHGELFLCADDAVMQSKEFKTTWQAEVVRYVVHGVLHLLGHDDLKPPLRRKMKREENRLVQILAKAFRFTEL